MAFYDNMVKRFEGEFGVIGFDASGRIILDRYIGTVDGYNPAMDSIWNIQDPTKFTKLYERVKAGDTSVIGDGDGMNDAGFEITATGVRAELNIGMDTYEEDLTFAEFDPILEAWQNAWTAAQAYRGRSKV